MYKSNRRNRKPRPKKRPNINIIEDYCNTNNDSKIVRDSGVFIDRQKDTNTTNGSSRSTITSWADRLKRRPEQPNNTNTNKTNTNSVVNSTNTGYAINRGGSVKAAEPPIDPNKKYPDGRHIKLRHRYTLWCHDIYNKNWSISSYRRLCSFDNVADYFKVFNNFHKLGLKYHHYFLMKEGIDPIWEHRENRDGGLCKFKAELDDSLEVWVDIAHRFICGTICDKDRMSSLIEDIDPIDDINGISISPKNSWAVVKIWNRDKNNDLSITLCQPLLDKYGEFRYNANTPEY